MSYLRPTDDPLIQKRHKKQKGDPQAHLVYSAENKMYTNAAQESIECAQSSQPPCVCAFCSNAVTRSSSVGGGGPIWNQS